MDGYIAGNPIKGDYMWLDGKPVTFWGFSDGLALYIPGHLMSQATSCESLKWTRDAA